VNSSLHLPALPRGWPHFALLVLVLLAMGGALANGWLHDDVPQIERNVAVHDGSGLWTGFVEPYWPPPDEGGLYRPLARTFHTLQWQLGGGTRVVFQFVNLLLYALLVIAIYGLGREVATRSQAWFAAALFAVHPVHVETVALAVNQAETVVGLAAVLSLHLWIRWREGKSPGPRTFAAIVLLQLLALGFKEHAAIFPLLLGAWELLHPVGERQDRRARLGALAALFVVVAGWWALRTNVLGSTGGAIAAEGIRGVGPGERALTMLGVAGEWVRLLVWPAHLQGDYSPWEIAPWSEWAGEQTAGLIAMGSFLLALGLAWKTDRRIAFALAWVAIAIAPVSNLVIPTGILLAERTLFLPSLGVALAAGLLIPRNAWQADRWRVPLLAGLLTVLMLGTFQSASRMRVWRDRPTYIASLAHDAPESWRSLTAAGIEEMNAGRRAEGEVLLLAAHSAWPGSARPPQLLAFYYRIDGLCGPAVPYLYYSIRIRPRDRWTRLPLVACLLDLGQYDAARKVAVADTGADLHGRALVNAIRVADSAKAAGAAPGTVRLPRIEGGLTLIGPVTRP
jgi:hypothetical protein